MGSFTQRELPQERTEEYEAFVLECRARLVPYGTTIDAKAVNRGPVVDAFLDGVSPELFIDSLARKAVAFKNAALFQRWGAYIGIFGLVVYGGTMGRPYYSPPQSPSQATTMAVVKFGLVAAGALMFIYGTVKKSESKPG